MDYKEEGRIAAKVWNTSPIYASYNHNLPAKDIMKIFLEPIENDMMQVSRPLPKKNQEWIEGFNEGVQL